MNILFITSNRVGDAVLSTGLLRHLTDLYPQARFTIICGPYAAGLFRAVPRLERLIILRKKKWNLHWMEAWRQCAPTRWDLIVDLRNSIISRLLRAGQLACRAKNSGQHKVIENARVLNLNPPPVPKIWLDAEAEKNAARILPPSRPLLALAPAANWPPKQWPVKNFIALAQKLTAADGSLPGASILVITDAHERATAQPLLEAFPGRSVPIIGEDLLTAAACLKECALFIGNDSGLMHLAAAMHTPTLGLFGPGQEAVYGPWGPHARYVCTPESRDTLLARLPSLHAVSPNLMEGLSTDSAFRAACGLLNAEPS
ncbi:MAG: glycosyltransferase family 9 protein [Alphaproteobacteria bacterium]|nr:glycosyltransferase family 9 protein [Alphaproteobacteria bacterium]